MKTYKILWCDGTEQEITGENFYEALYNSGVKVSAALPAIDFVEEIK